MPTKARVRTRRLDAPTCSVEDCDLIASARGWCDMHYSRWRRHGDPLGGGRSYLSSEYLFEEIEWLLSYRVHPSQIATQLGASANSISRTCVRYGRSEWAQLFAQEARASRA